MTQLKISDLSVDDWVEFHRTKGIYIAQPLFDKAYAQVIGTHRGAEVSLLVDGKREFMAIPLSAIHPIPITPEILEKNGFEKREGRLWYNPHIKCGCYHFGYKYWDIRIKYKNRARIAIDNILHIHQLQHALRLAGVEKEIEV